MRIAAIMPCRGRPEQTVRNVRRLLATAGDVAWELRLVGGMDESGMLSDIARAIASDGGPSIIIGTGGAPRLTYWQAMALGTQPSDATHLVNLANDLLPGRDWLARAVDAYRATFGPNAGMLGFNDGIHEVGHSPHVLIDRGLLEALGGWPVWYRHNYGDTELVARTTALNSYAKAPWAVLYHDHHLTGGDTDAVYAEGDATAQADRRLFEQRRQQGWPAVDSR